MNVVGVGSRSMRVMSSMIMAGSLLVLSVIMPSGTWAEGSTKADDYPGHLVFLPGERLVLGTVEAIEGGMIRINIGELEPRFIPIKGASEK